MNPSDRKGRLETVNALHSAKPGDYIVTNTRTLHNESYVVPMEEFEQNYIQAFPHNNPDAYTPVGNTKNAIQITGDLLTSLDIFCSMEGRHLSQIQLMDFFSPFLREERYCWVKKDAGVLATQLNQHLIDILKSVGGLCTFVSETNSRLVTLITAPWGDTQPIHENDWVIISTKQAYVIAEAEFNSTYTVQPFQIREKQ